MNDHRLPNLDASSPWVARVSTHAFSVTFLALALLVAGWVAVLAQLRFTDAIPVAGELVAMDAGGRWQVQLSSSAGVDAVQPGARVHLRLADRPGAELLAEVTRVDAATRRLDAVLSASETEPATHLRPGTRVMGRLSVGSLSGLELLARLLRGRAFGNGESVTR